MKVNELQREVKSLESQAAEEEENIKRLASVRERAKTSFFAVMRPRLKAQDLLKYGTGKRIQLDRDLLILQRALNNKVPDWPEGQDWKLPLIIDQFQNSQLKAMISKFLCFILTSIRLSFSCSKTVYFDMVIFTKKSYVLRWVTKNSIRLVLKV